jgi:hypothetical protein
MGTMGAYPEWVEEHNDTGIEIKQRGDNYYAYKVTSKWNPDKGYSEKITEAYLGTVTPDGIRPPKHKRDRNPQSVLDTGQILLLDDVYDPLKPSLKDNFPDTWQTLLAVASLKLCYNAPFKRLHHHHQTSWSSHLWDEATLSKNCLTERVREWGEASNYRRQFFRSLVADGDYVAIDLTQVYSDSANIAWLEAGYNPHEAFQKQLQLLLVHNLTEQLPAFLKLLPGSIRDVSSLENAIAETEFEDILVVVDKGFWSSANFAELEASNLGYLAAVRRNATELNYVRPAEYPDHFEWKDRQILARSYEVDEGRVIHHFLDMEMRADEHTTGLERIDGGGKSREDFESKRQQLGTLALLTNRAFSSQDAYTVYKQRFEIEKGFDVLTNTLEADKSYMQDRQAMEGYMFVLFLALYAHAAILNRLRDRELTNQYSVPDVLEYLAKFYRVEVDGEVVDSAVPKQTRELADELDVPITQNVGS